MNPVPDARLDALLRAAASVRILVVGDLMLDVYLQGQASRISPEAPVPVVHVTEDWHALGGAANVAANVVALGAACTVAGCVGSDAAGARLRDELARRGIDGRGVLALGDRPTTVKTRVMVRHLQVARYDRETDAELAAADAGELARLVDAHARDVDAIVLEDYDKGVCGTAVIRAALDAGRARGIPTVVDPKLRHFFAYAGATVFKPNLAELAAALRAPVIVDDDDWLERTRRHLDCSHLLVTLGEDGMALRTDAGESVRIPTVARAVYDVSGAGDTVTAALAVALAAGATPAEAATLANYAAGIEVGKPGVATVTAEELRTEIQSRQRAAVDRTYS
jgi:rfaE bifunctional protein kinase chain/domain